MCHVQTMEEILTTGKSQFMSDHYFIKAKKAYELCLTFLWIEEKFNIISENYLEWEKEIFDIYNFILENTNDKQESDQIIKTQGKKSIVMLNRRLANILGSIRMYRDQVSHDLSTISKMLELENLEKDFKEETNNQYDKSIGYQIMEFIRNYMQHQGMIIEKLTAIVPFFNRNQSTEFLFFAEVDYKRIKEIKGFKNKIKLINEIDTNLEWINVVELVRQYFNGIIELHSCYRKITNTIFDEAIENIRHIIGLHYNYNVINQVAFLAKKCDNTYKDFLFQKCFIDDVVNYRQADIAPSTNKYYLNRKSYISSNRNLANSIRLDIRYNMV
ncbi:hypothetical protein Gferi_18920 [Geosporobacter ferrireducens]|uniref:Uncharacterized protein n=2 Tax=Geosporobacter ferrireducens TaxID=1424294 RepID=A0A1D8GKG7_9FIRM|nr:hypothetical protein Gferi_18920 [Geosporobacter ferrireducens]